MEVHKVESCVRGYHVYGDSWTPNVGDLLDCQESGNPNDAYAVAIKNGANVIGHVPRKLSAACSLFLRLGGTMNCEITDSHQRYSADLPHGAGRVRNPLQICISTSVLDSKEVPALSCSFFFTVTNFHNAMLREFVRLQCLTKNGEF